MPFTYNPVPALEVHTGDIIRFMDQPCEVLAVDRLLAVNHVRLLFVVDGIEEAVSFNGTESLYVQKGGTR